MYYKCCYDILISLKQAALYSDISVTKWRNLIKDGTVEAHGNEDLLYININYLPKHAARKYLVDYLVKDRAFNVDLIGYLSRFGHKALLSLFNEIQNIKNIKNIKSMKNMKNMKNMKIYSSPKNSTYYRKEKIFMQSELRKLLKPQNTSYHSKQLCKLSEQFIIYHYSLPNAQSQTKIWKELEDEATLKGNAVCKACPFNSASHNHAKMKGRYGIIECDNIGHGMIVPQNRHIVNRFIKSLDPQIIVMARQGDCVWKDQYLHKTKRDRPQKSNAVWFGDHHLADIIVILGVRDGKFRLGRPWLTVITDAAHGAIIGSVVTMRPNSHTIAECFCRAAAFTVDSPFFGLPEVFYVDRGKDYSAKWLEGRDPILKERVDQSMRLNRALCEHPLLPALNVTVRHALPRTGRSKVIERTLGTITREFFQKLPGWTGNCLDNRPYDFIREQKHLLSSGKIMMLKDFAMYWFDVVVPGYNNLVSNDIGLSPLQLYERLPRAETIVPDWDSLSVLMVEKKQHKVHPQGIKYRNELYWHPYLRDYIGQYVQIYDFDQSFCHSLTVLADGKFICEAEPLVHQNIIEEDRIKLRHHLEEQNSQKRNISKKITAVKRILKSSDIDTERYEYVEAIDIERDKEEATILSPEANAIAQLRDAQLEAIHRIIDDNESTELDDYFMQKAREVKNG